MDLHLVGGRGRESAPECRLPGAQRTQSRRWRWHPRPCAQRKGRTHRGALMNHLDTVLLEVIHVFLRLVAGGFDDLYAALDDGVPVLCVGGRVDGRIVKFTPKGLSVISRVRAISLARSSGVGWVSAVSPAPSVSHGATICVAYPLHPTLNDGVLNSERFREAGLNRHGALLSGAGGRRQRAKPRSLPEEKRFRAIDFRLTAFFLSTASGTGGRGGMSPGKRGSMAGELITSTPSLARALGSEGYPFLRESGLPQRFQRRIQHERLYLRVRASAPVIATQRCSRWRRSARHRRQVAGGPDHQPLPLE